MRYWGYSPKSSNPAIHLYGVRVVGPAKYIEDVPYIRADGEQRRLLFEDMPYEPGHPGGPVLGVRGGVVAMITQGDTDGKWFRATEIGPLLPFVRFVFPRKEPWRGGL